MRRQKKKNKLRFCVCDLHGWLKFEYASTSSVLCNIMNYIVLISFKLHYVQNTPLDVLLKKITTRLKHPVNVLLSELAILAHL